MARKPHYADMPPYLLWGPIMQEAMIDFIERAGWLPDDTIGYWTHPQLHPERTGFLKAFEITSDSLFEAPPEHEPNDTPETGPVDQE